MRRELSLPGPGETRLRALDELSTAPLRVLSTTHWASDARTIVLAPVKPFDFLLAPASGTIDAAVDGRPCRVAAGQALLVAAGTPHRGVRGRGCAEVVACTLHLDLRDAAGAPLLARWRGPVLDVPGGWSDGLARIHAIPEPALRHRLAALHLRALLLAQPAPEERLLAPASAGRLSGLLAQMDARCAEPWPEAAMAAVAGLSPAQLRTVFRREVGCAPHRHLVHLRLRRAGDRLHAGATVAEAAAAAGFASVRGLRLAFRRIFGRPPGGWRWDV